MQVVKSKAISIDELREHLKEKREILLWISRIMPSWKILKSDYDSNKYTYGWVSLYFNRGYDNMNMRISTIEDLINLISNQLEKGNQFHWFSSINDFYRGVSETKLERGRNDFN